MVKTLPGPTLGGTCSGAITITRTGRAWGVLMVVAAVVSGRKGRILFQDHQNILSTAAEACQPGKKGKLMMLLGVRSHQQMGLTTEEGRLKQSTGMPV